MTLTIIHDPKEPQTLDFTPTEDGPLVVTGARVRVIVRGLVVFDTLVLRPPPKAA